MWQRRLVKSKLLTISINQVYHYFKGCNNNCNMDLIRVKTSHTLSVSLQQQNLNHLTKIRNTDGARYEFQKHIFPIIPTDITSPPPLSARRQSSVVKRPRLSEVCTRLDPRVCGKLNVSHNHSSFGSDSHGRKHISNISDNFLL